MFYHEGTADINQGNLLLELELEPLNILHMLLLQEVGFFDEARTGELISRLHTDIGAASDMVSQNLTVMIRSTLHILVLSSFMLVTCWRLTVVSFVMVPFTECVAKASHQPETGEEALGPL